MPKERLKVSHRATTGAKQLAILVVPNGWIKNSKTKIAHEVPTTVLELMSCLTISRLVRVSCCFVQEVRNAELYPCIAPRTD